MSEQLTANELEILIDLASAGERYTPEQYAVIKSAERVLAAMRTPITAEALTAAGWVTTYDSPNSTSFVFKGIESLVDVEVSPHGTHVYVNDAGMNDPRLLPNVRTMHDLTELVRLLGGE